MPVYVEWDNEEHTIIRIHIHDSWELNEYFEASLQAQTFMKDVDYPVHLIIDLTDMNIPPKRLLSSAISTVDSHILPNQGLVVAVKFSRYLQTVIKVASRVFPRLSHNVVFAHTLKDAYILISKYEHDHSASQS